MIRASSSVLPTPNSSSSKHTARQDDCAPSTQHPGLGVPTFGWRHRRTAVRRVLDVEIAAIADNSDDAAGFDGPCALAKREKPNQLGRSSFFFACFHVFFSVFVDVWLRIFPSVSACPFCFLRSSRRPRALSHPPLPPHPNALLSQTNTSSSVLLSIQQPCLPVCLSFSTLPFIAPSSSPAAAPRGP